MLRQLFTTPKIAAEYSAHAPFFVIGDTSFREEVNELLSSIDEKLRTLASISERLELIPIAPGLGRAESTSQAEKIVSHKKIFLVHGHDEAARETVARFLEKLDLEPIILHEQASEGRTIVEKLEHHGDVKYAVVLLTPDDVGGKSSTDLKQRARQNVVLELGYFLARLGRPNVCALYKGEVEIPSDYMGVIYISYDNAGGWRLHLAKELKAAKFSIDMNKAI